MQRQALLEGADEGMGGLPHRKTQMGNDDMVDGSQGGGGVRLFAGQVPSRTVPKEEVAEGGIRPAKNDIGFV